MTEPMKVVLADRRDQAELAEHLWSHHKENDIFGTPKDMFPPDEDEVRAMLDRAFDQTGAIIGVVRDGEKLAGSVYILITKMWWTKRYHLEELWTFVRPEYRSTNCVRLLTEFAKDCARQMDRLLFTAVITNNRTESKTRLYKRAYGYPAGVYFMFNAGDEQPAPNGSVTFWDSPFPRSGIAVLQTAALSQKELDELSRWKKRAINHSEVAAHG